MSGHCTWESCLLEPEYEELDKQGQVWAELCQQHHCELNEAIRDWASDGGPKVVMKAYIKAQGGSKKAADRAMKKDGNALQKVAQLLVDLVNRGKGKK